MKLVTIRLETHGDKVGENKDTFGLPKVIHVVSAKLLPMPLGDYEI